MTSASRPVKPSVSMTMPGLVTRVRSPPSPRSTSIRTVSWIIKALVKSSVTSPAVSLISIRRGITHWPARVASPKRWSIRIRSLACRSIPLGGKSAVSIASSLRVRAESAASTRSSSSSAASRPSLAAAVSVSTTRSRSACDTLSSSRASCSGEPFPGAEPFVMISSWSPRRRLATLPSELPGSSLVACRPAGHRQARGIRVLSLETGSDHQLGRSVCVAGRPACPQVSRCIGLSGSDRKFPALTGRSGTQRARRLRPRTTVDASAPWSSSPPGDLRITRVFRCVARGSNARVSFMFAGCCWWRSLAVDGDSGAPRGHGHAVRWSGFSVGRRGLPLACKEQDAAVSFLFDVGGERTASARYGPSEPLPNGTPVRGVCGARWGCLLPARAGQWRCCRGWRPG